MLQIRSGRGCPVVSRDAEPIRVHFFRFPLVQSFTSTPQFWHSLPYLNSLTLPPLRSVILPRVNELERRDVLQNRPACPGMSNGSPLVAARQANLFRLCFAVPPWLPPSVVQFPHDVRICLSTARICEIFAPNFSLTCRVQPSPVFSRTSSSPPSTAASTLSPSFLVCLSLSTIILCGRIVGC